MNDYMTVFVDAGTKNNGKRGHQKTRIVVTDENGIVLFEKFIGDYTNNEGEILAIIAALRNVEPRKAKHIYSDSRIAVNWTLAGKNYEQQLRKAAKNRLSDRLIHFINAANVLFLLSDSVITWIPREKNKAGIYLEDTFKI